MSDFTVTETMTNNGKTGAFAGELLEDRTGGQALPIQRATEGGMIEETINIGGQGRIPVRAQPADESPADAVTTSSPPAAAAPTPPTQTAPAAAPVAADGSSNKLAELEATVARQAEALTARTAEAEKLRASMLDEGTAKRAKTLDSALTTYDVNPTLAIRQFIAANLGIDDPNHESVLQEYRDLYADLTAAELSVPLDPAHQAKRESARTRREWEREKRQREARDKETQETAVRSERDTKVQAVQSEIATSLKAKSDQYPNLLGYAEHLDGIKPEQAIWRFLEAAAKQGLIDPKADEATLITQGAQLAETHYQTRAAKLRGLFIPSTAPPASLTTAPAVADQSRQPNAPKTLTNADASVAPATQPAPIQPVQTQRPKFKNDRERMEYALRHLRERT